MALDEIRELYDRVAIEYADLFCSDGVLNAEASYVQELARVGTLTNSRLLDVGCGPAVYLRLAERAALRYVGVDFSAEMLRVGRNRFPGVCLARADARSLPMAASVVDLAVAMGSLSHMTNEDFHIAMGEIARVLRTEGALLLGDQVGNQPIRAPYPLATGCLVPVFPRSEEFYCDELTRWGFAVVRTEVREPGPGEIALRKVLLWARLSKRGQVL